MNPSFNTIFGTDFMISQLPLVNHGMDCSQFLVPKVSTLSTLITCNAMNWPGGAAISWLHRLHSWLKLCTLGQYIVNVQWSTTAEALLTIFTFWIWVWNLITPDPHLIPRISGENFQMKARKENHINHHLKVYVFPVALQMEWCRPIGSNRRNGLYHWS